MTSKKMKKYTCIISFLIFVICLITYVLCFPIALKELNNNFNGTYVYRLLHYLRFVLVSSLVVGIITLLDLLKIFKFPMMNRKIELSFIVLTIVFVACHLLCSLTGVSWEYFVFEKLNFLISMRMILDIFYIIIGIFISILLLNKYK